MQYQIPQFIDVEDKIVGPFSLRQFFFVGGAAGASLLIYALVSNLFLWIVSSAILMSIGIGLAFIKVQGRPLPTILASAALYFWSPRRYLVQKGTQEKERKSGFSIDSILQGLALRSAREKVDTGSQASRAVREFGRTKERYMSFGVISGERRVGKRIDYR